MKIQDALDLHLKEEASRIIGDIRAKARQQSFLLIRGGVLETQKVLYQVHHGFVIMLQRNLGLVEP